MERTTKVGMRGQQWSLEVILAISIFIIVFVFMVSFLSFRPSDDTGRLELQSIALYEELRGPGGFLDGNRVDLVKLQSWSAASRSETQADLRAIKRKVGMVGDFCIYFENAQGQIIPNTLDGDIFYGVGDRTIQFNGTDAHNEPINIECGG